MANSSTRGDRRRAAGLAGAALALALASCAGDARKGALLLHPVPPTAENYAMVQGALVYSEPGLSVSVRPWDWRLVEQEFARAGMKSPYGDGEGDASRFFFLRVRFENRSAQTLAFNPLGASLRGPGGGPAAAIEISDLYFLAGDDAGVAARAEAFRRTSFDGLTRVRPGEEVERYLVFRAPEEGKEQILTLRDVYLGSRGVDLDFLFEVFPGAAP